MPALAPRSLPEHSLKVGLMGLFSIKRLVFVVLLAAVGVGVYYKMGTGSPAAEPQASKDGKGGKGFGKGGFAKGGPSGPVTVTVASVEQRAVPVRVAAIGNVEPFTSVQIKARIDGQIVEVNFKEGQEVKQGDVLFRIDPRPYEAALKQAEAAAARDRATLERAKQQEQRYKELLDKNFVSPDGYAQFRTNAQTAEAVAGSSDATVENARVQVDYTTIRAPVSGFVGKILLQRGNIARAADPNAIAVINQVHPIYVSFAVPEKFLSDIRTRMKAGSLAVETVPSDSKKPVTGKLVFIDNSVDQSTGTIKLRAEFANNDNVLWPGQFANASLRLYDEANALVVPSRAVQTGPDGQFVFVVKADMTVEVRPVKVERNDGESAIVAEGLRKDERVVTQGQLRLAPGTRVAIAGGEPVPSAANERGSSS
jgi:multidrug efflux system membrane fusion protein